MAWRMAATLRDIALQTGVSRSITSLVLQDGKRVPGPTKVRVRHVMADLGYIYRSMGGPHAQPAHPRAWPGRVWDGCMSRDIYVQDIPPGISRVAEILRTLGLRAFDLESESGIFILEGAP